MKRRERPVQPSNHLSPCSGLLCFSSLFALPHVQAQSTAVLHLNYNLHPPLFILSHSRPRLVCTFLFIFVSFSHIYLYSYHFHPFCSSPPFLSFSILLCHCAKNPSSALPFPPSVTFSLFVGFIGIIFSRRKMYYHTIIQKKKHDFHINKCSEMLHYFFYTHSNLDNCARLWVLAGPQ